MGEVSPRSFLEVLSMKNGEDPDSQSQASDYTAVTSTTPKVRRRPKKRTEDKIPNVTAGETTPKQTPKKQKVRSKSVEVKEKNDPVDWKSRILVLTVAVATSASIAAFMAMSLLSTYEVVDLVSSGSLKNALELKVFGQDDAIAEVLTHLKDLQDFGSLKVILLVGGPGVGKDLVAQTVTSELFQHSDQSCKDSAFLLLDHEGRICVRSNLNVISLETVREEKDVYKAMRLIGKIRDMEAKGVVLLPILAAKALTEKENVGLEMFKTIDNYQELIYSRGQMFQDLMTEDGVETEMILFRPVTEKVVQQCMGSSDSTASKIVMQGREFSLNGCKGLEFET